MSRQPRRLRRTPALRSLVQETRLHVQDLIYPLFIVEGQGIKRETAMPDVFHFSVDKLSQEISELSALGIRHVLLFGIPCDSEKDPHGSPAYAEQGVVQRAIRAIKQANPDMQVITDICLCEYTDHGQCGLLDTHGHVDNAQTLPYLAKVAMSHAQAGADMIAPSDMMDGRVAHLRQTLDSNGYSHLPIMAYSAKYASNYYGPFRQVAQSAPQSGDRKGYQMDYHNSNEAMVECELDIAEGADIIMIKPALAYLDIISRVSRSTNIPVAAYNVSGEYVMLKNAIAQGILSPDVIYETLISIKRAGASMIITYFAKEIAVQLAGN